MGIKIQQAYGSTTVLISFCKWFLKNLYPSVSRTFFMMRGVPGNGMLLTGVFAHKNVNSSVTVNGLFYGETHLFFVHFVALVAVAAFAFFGSLLLLKITDPISGLRVSAAEEIAGLDITQHDEGL